MKKKVKEKERRREKGGEKEKQNIVLGMERK